MREAIKGIAAVIAVIVAGTGALGVALAALSLVLLPVYALFWVFAYPAIGSYCTSGGTVAESKLDGTFWTGESRYKTTFKDGTQAYTTYATKDEYVCLKADAHFWPWDWGKQS